MNTTVPLTDQPLLRQRLNRWFDQCRPVWVRYWPLILIAIGVVWLGMGWHQQSLESSLGRYYELIGEAARKARTAGGTFNKGFSVGYEAGRQTAVLVGVFFRILLPCLLILSGIGHYQYWYVTRQVLLSSGSGGKWGYAFSLIILFMFLLSISLTTFGKQAARAGIVNFFPVLTVGYLVGYSMVIHLRERQREDRDLAQAKRQAELDALKAQVNPPFLFHALQGLHETAVAENLPRTIQSLDQLTGIMQYVLEESRNQTTDIAREIGFIRDYLRLQQLRVPDRDNIRITTEIDWDEKPAHIVPLLLNPLIENAFKYGISMQHPCFVAIRFRVADAILVFTTENSVLPRNDLEAGTGLGLKNVRRRLQLAYPDRYKLTIGEQEGVYRVELKVKLI